MDDNVIALAPALAERPFKTFLFEYRMPDGTEWGFEVLAAHEADALARLEAIKVNGHLRGELVAVIPA